MAEVEATVEFLKAVMDFSRTGVKPDWIEVEYGPYDIRGYKDSRPKRVKSQEVLEEIDRKNKELWELYSHGNVFGTICSKWVCYGHCGFDDSDPLCSKEHPPEYRGKSGSILDNELAFARQRVQNGQVDRRILPPSGCRGGERLGKLLYMVPRFLCSCQDVKAAVDAVINRNKSKLFETLAAAVLLVRELQLPADQREAAGGENRKTNKVCVTIVSVTLRCVPEKLLWPKKR
ncbi:hypothetical protein SELMODRAFT_430987 [Selaginella moellendorffii]|uniref:Uncharacterized protein n=1 Tax=Selaginella moellendorffii TaxID=88036 RepID=D8TB58_SELML|nr:hypothetical protein SELMODRAFT_430987 [Selaginella moellendorffii]